MPRCLMQTKEKNWRKEGDIMQLLFLKALAVMGDIYNGADWIVRGISQVVIKAIGG